MGDSDAPFNLGAGSAARSSDSMAIRGAWGGFTAHVTLVPRFLAEPAGVGAKCCRMKFAEFKPGRIISAGRRRVTEEEIIEFATRYDPQWFHTDPQRAAGSRWQGLIASGWLTCSIAMQLLVTHVLTDSESIGSPGLEQVKWPNPLRPGEEVSLTVEVLQSRVSSSGKVGIVRWRWLLTTQSGVQVLDIIGTSLFELPSSV
ncbi:MAG: acyl dehydratase [Gammaproteobacteria bacterium]|nr:acyl dehydratase [Gammaproteobacteria bacterium]